MKTKLKIDKQKCIGCGLCPATAPETFSIDYEKGKAKVKKQPSKITEEIKKAVKNCPVSAIKFENNE